LVVFSQILFKLGRFQLEQADEEMEEEPELDKEFNGNPEYQSQQVRHDLQPGVDVRITIFCDF
jgi:hypothetical protein